LPAGNARRVGKLDGDTSRAVNPKRTAFLPNLRERRRVQVRSRTKAVLRFKAAVARWMERLLPNRASKTDDSASALPAGKVPPVDEMPFAGQVPRAGQMPRVGKLGGDTSRAPDPGRTAYLPNLREQRRDGVSSRANKALRSGDRKARRAARSKRKKAPKATAAAAPAARRFTWRRRHTLTAVTVLSILVVVALVIANLGIATGRIRWSRTARDDDERVQPPLDQPGADLRGVDYGWAHLRGANLHGANLEDAHLQGAYLTRADLGEANLTRATLQGASLLTANLRQAILEQADLRYAQLANADLREANLLGADLRGANLEFTDLRGAQLEGANTNDARLDGAILPDGSEWTVGVDMRHFTDPTHAEFWRP
jgi:hypothetical protein